MTAKEAKSAVRISGFSFARNAGVLDYPLREALLSALPVVDELVVAVAPGEPDDDTRGLVESIGDPRIRIIDAVWDESRLHLAYSDLTNAALDACEGDWCLYLQADEVLHEHDHLAIRSRCAELLEDRRVEGMLFDYLHFFGDYRHVQRGQGWYSTEIRLVRNGIGVRSVRDAQSFRRRDRRLTVARSRARVFHYGWVRHPARMRAKVEAFWAHRGRADPDARFGAVDDSSFDYGPLTRLEEWTGRHPAVMAERMRTMDWRHLLREVDPPGLARGRVHRDERPLYRALTSLSRLTGIDLNHKNHGRLLDV